MKLTKLQVRSLCSLQSVQHNWAQ